MTTPKSPGYVLLDPRPIAAHAPYTFFLPDAAETAAIASGDLAQLMFEHIPAGQEWGVERMWVKVDTATDSELTGALVSKPFEATASVREGDPVTFARHQVIGISWANPENAPRPSTCREYWERCLVDDCVLDGTEPVEFIYREEPDMQEEGDKYRDSGWRIRGRMGDASDDEIDARAPKYVAVGAVLNKDDSWVQFIDAPIGTRLMRDFKTNDYLPEG